MCVCVIVFVCVSEREIQREKASTSVYTMTLHKICPIILCYILTDFRVTVNVLI